MIIKNQVLNRPNKKPIVWDVFCNKNSTLKPLIIFCHGYKGFKDWGTWNLVATEFMKANLCFVKFNFSHNGGTIENPIDFPDLEAFAENNYSKELEDLDAMLNYVLSNNFEISNEIDPNNVTIIGHSRGGGISVIKASEDKRITKLITWASVSSFGKRTSTTGDLEKWKQDGVKYVLNGRTKQMMPHNYQFYLDFKENEQRLDIEKAAEKLQIPHLIIHAKNDNSVLFSEAENLHRVSDNSRLMKIEDSNHVFGAKHPWHDRNLPSDLEKVVMESINFIKN